MDTAAKRREAAGFELLPGAVPLSEYTAGDWADTGAKVLSGRRPAAALQYEYDDPAYMREQEAQREAESANLVQNDGYRGLDYRAEALPGQELTVEQEYSNYESDQLEESFAKGQLAAGALEQSTGGLAVSFAEMKMAEEERERVARMQADAARLTTEAAVTDQRLAGPGATQDPLASNYATPSPTGYDDWYNQLFA